MAVFSANEIRTFFPTNQKRSIELFSQLLTFDNNGLFHVLLLELFMVTFTERYTNNFTQNKFKFLFQNFKNFNEDCCSKQLDKINIFQKHI